MTPRQKNLVALMPKVEAGEMTLQDAMIKAGYAPTTAREQSIVMGSLGKNTKMQEALKNAGFTEEYLASGVVEGTKATSVTQSGDEHADYRARGIFYKLGAELLDAFPAQKNINAEVGIADLIKAQEASTQ